MRVSVKEIYRYYIFITHLFLKGKLNYPNPLFGHRLSDTEIIDSWKKTKALMKSGKAPSKFNLYVHIPFCVCKCIFCMSVSFQTKKTASVVKRHLKDLHDEIELLSPTFKEIPVSSFYLGGGTPSLLSGPQITELFGMLKSFDLEKTRIIFEASPQTLDKEKIQAIKDCGVTELALGVQSFDDLVLKKNCRPQNSDYVRKIYRIARDIGIPSITFDIMVGLPYQSDISAIDSVKEAIRLRPDGILLNSFLALEHTEFMLSGGQDREKISVARKAHELLTDAGYFVTRQGYRLKWSEADDEKRYETQESDSLLGLGYGAFSHAYGTLKYQKLNRVDDYFKRFEPDSFVNDTEKSFLALAQDKPFYKENQDYIGIRLDKRIEMCTYAFSNISNLSLEEFEDRFGEDFNEIFKENIEILTKLGLIHVDNKVTLLKDERYSRQIVKVFFIDKGYIERMVKSYKIDYDPKADYLSQVKELSRFE